MNIAGDMNYYGDLLKVDGSLIYYSYGCSTKNMTGILMIDTKDQSWTNMRFPDGIEKESRMFRSFANKVLGQCSRGEIHKKVSREIG